MGRRPFAGSAQLSADADSGVAPLEALEPTRRVGGPGAAPTLPGLGASAGSVDASTMVGDSAFYQVMIRALPNDGHPLRAHILRTAHDGARRQSHRQGARRSLAVRGEASARFFRLSGGRSLLWGGAPAEARPAGRHSGRPCRSAAGDGAGAGRSGPALSLHHKPLPGHLSHIALAQGALGGPALAAWLPTPAATVAAAEGARRSSTLALRVASLGAHLWPRSPWCSPTKRWSHRWGAGANQPLRAEPVGTSVGAETPEALGGTGRLPAGRADAAARPAARQRSDGATAGEPRRTHSRKA